MQADLTNDVRWKGYLARHSNSLHGLRRSVIYPSSTVALEETSQEWSAYSIMVFVCVLCWLGIPFILFFIHHGGLKDFYTEESCHARWQLRCKHLNNALHDESSLRSLNVSMYQPCLMNVQPTQPLTTTWCHMFVFGNEFLIKSDRQASLLIQEHKNGEILSMKKMLRTTY